MRTDIPKLGETKPLTKKDAKPLAAAFGNIGKKVGARMTPVVQKDLRMQLHDSFAKYNIEDGRMDKLTGSGLRIDMKDMRSGVAGYHTSDGLIAMDRDGVERASRFVQRAASSDKTIGQQIRDLSKTYGDVTMPDGTLRRAGEVVRDMQKEAHAYHTLVHEGLHGYGPRYQGFGGGNAYQAHGVLVEEVTTEVAARRIMRDTFDLQRGDVESMDIPKNKYGSGSYNNLIDAAMGAVDKALYKNGSGAIGGELQRDRAFRHIEEASLRLKSAKPPELSQKDIDAAVDAERKMMEKANAATEAANPGKGWTRYAPEYIKMRLNDVANQKHEMVDSPDKLTRAFANSFDFDSIGETSIGKRLTDAEKKKLADDIFDELKKAGSSVTAI